MKGGDELHGSSLCKAPEAGAWGAKQGHRDGVHSERAQLERWAQLERFPQPEQAGSYWVILGSLGLCAVIAVGSML